MIEKLKNALDNKESVKGTVIMYGKNDFFDDEVFVLGDNPLICIPKEELKNLKPISYIGKEVEYIPINIDEENEVIIGKVSSIINQDDYPLDNDEDVELGTKLEGVIKDLFPTGCFIPVLPGKDALCYFSPSMNKDVDIDEGSRVVFIINKISKGRYRGKVVEVLS